MNKKMQKGIVAAVAASLGTGIVAPVYAASAETTDLASKYAKAYEATVNAKTQKELTAARTLVDALYAEVKGTANEYLATTLSSLLDPLQQKELVKLDSAIKAAEVSVKQADVNAARALIVDMPVVWRNAFSSYIDTIQNKIIASAVEAAKKAQTSSSQADLNTAKALYEELLTVTNNDGVKSWVETALKAELDKVVVKLEISSVTPVAHNTAKLVFNQPVEAVDAFNFDVDGGNDVIKAELLADKVTVNLTFANSFVDGAEYKVTATEIKIAGQTTEAADLTATFDYDLAGIASVDLTKKTFVIGENVKDYVVIKDKNGYEVSKADYSIDNIESSNTAVVDATGNVLAEGTSNLRFTVFYHDQDTILSGFLRIDVNTASNGLIAGYELDAAANTVENSVKSAMDVPELYLGTADDAGKLLFVYIKDSNGDATTQPLDLSTAGDYVVTSRSTGVLAVSQDATGAKIVPVAAGTGTIEIKNPSTGWKQTVTVKVFPAAKYADLKVGVAATTVKLSDNSAAGTPVEGVNLKSTYVKWVDQNGDSYVLDAGASVNAASTAKEQIINDAIKTGDKLVISTTSTAFELAANADGTFTVTAVDGASISSAVVKVSYYAAATDLTPKTTKTFNVSVVNVNETAAPYDYEVSVSNTKLLTADDTTTSVNEKKAIFTVYSVDKNKNRLDDVTSNVALSFARTTDAEVQNWFDITTTANEVVYGTATNNPALYMPKGGTINIEYTVNGASNPHGSVALTYADKTGIPYKATVSNSPLLIDLDRFASGGDVTVDELLFGVINANELVLDDVSDADVTSDATNDDGIAIRTGADGYVYTPAVKITDVANAAVKTGAAVYGIDTTAQLDGNVFGNPLGVSDDFTVEYAITNAKDVADDGAGTFTITGGKTQGSFTLVVKSIKMTNDPRTEKLELLSAPVSINVVLTDK